MRATTQIAEMDDQDAYDIMTTAVECAIAYWVNEGDGRVSIDRDENLNVTSIEFDGDFGAYYRHGGTGIVVTPGSILWAANQILSGEVKAPVTQTQLLRWIATGDPDIDAEGADCIVQAAVFGDVVFG